MQRFGNVRRVTLHGKWRRGKTVAENCIALLECRLKMTRKCRYMCDRDCQSI